jgi:hypothetical protein
LTAGSFARSTVPFIDATPLPLEAIRTGLLAARLLFEDPAPTTPSEAAIHQEAAGRRTRWALSFLS